MGFHGGGETTLEDDIIYDPDIMHFIDEAEDGIRKAVMYPEPVGAAPDWLRMRLENLVYKIVKQERGF